MGISGNFLARFVVIGHSMPLGKHPLVQNARNQNSAGFLTVKNNVVFALHSVQASTNIIAASPQ